MKHTVLALLLVMAVSLGEAAAQNIALGERVPEMKHTVWLDGHRAAPSAATYIEFYHSANEMSDAALERLCRLCDDAECDLRLIVVTKEPAEKVAPRLRSLLSPHVAVALDRDGRVLRPSASATSPSGCSSTPGSARCGWATRSR